MRETEDRRQRTEKSGINKVIKDIVVKEAMLYEELGGGGEVRCNLCAHRCKISEGRPGICGVRQNKAGKLYTHVYGEVIASHVDPIEKKPLHHFFPGSKAYSIATVGCNFKCGFCQNWQISQSSKMGLSENLGYELKPAEIVRNAQAQGCKSISYTYTEPTVFFEYAYDTSRLAKDAGLYNSFVTNGYMTKEALKTISPYLDACNVDLKSFKDKFYKDICAGGLKPVLDSIRLIKELGIWIEITTLVVPDVNDSSEELREIAEFIASVDKDIPWHISRFHPDYKFTDSPPTSLETLKTAHAAGKASGLRHIYVGNVPGENENTMCYNCDSLLIERRYFAGKPAGLKDGKCLKCGTKLKGIF